MSQVALGSSAAGERPAPEFAAAAASATTSAGVISGGSSELSAPGLSDSAWKDSDENVGTGSSGQTAANAVKLVFLLHSGERAEREYKPTDTIYQVKAALVDNWPENFAAKPSATSDLRILYSGHFLDDKAVLADLIMRTLSTYLIAAAFLGTAAVVRANDYAAAGSADYASGDDSNDYAVADNNNNDYAVASNNNDYAVAANDDYAVASNDDYAVAPNNDYAVASNDDYNAGGGNDYATNAPYDDETTTVVIEGSSPCEPVVTPEFQTVVEDIVNTLVQYSTVVVQETQVAEVTQQVTNIQIQSVAAQQDALYQVTQTYVCPPPPTVTVNNVNNVWVTETATPTVQVVQTRVQPQVVVQPVTMTQEVQQVDVETQVIQEEATAVYTTNVHNMVQVVQQNVAQAQQVANAGAIVQNAGAYAPNAGAGVYVPNAGGYAPNGYVTADAGY
ncbi:hypothetical protein LPJ53_004167 [Coemansia erecta]|uniref:Ubiquitin-like domain-containing protein n=1 Tax=Coemansia erecta TaxID=147472 RepID=A0A9W7XUV9_9FUNG|nr:hypothetical protein LPJ53_004167 [Coemansia erecta]